MTGEKAPPASARFPGFPVPFALNSGFVDRQLLVITDDEKWRRAWELLHSNRRPVLTVPAVNFSEQMVLIYALGRQRTGGYSVRIDGAEVVEDRLNVNVVVSRPSSNCIVTSGLTSPVDLMLVPSSKHSVAVTETEIITEC